MKLLHIHKNWVRGLVIREFVDSDTRYFHTAICGKRYLLYACSNSHAGPGTIKKVIQRAKIYREIY